MSKFGSGRGRPRKDGDRLANDRLAPPGPNARTLEIRRALLVGPDDKRVWTMAGVDTMVAADADGNQVRIKLSKAENALDLCVIRHWMSEDQERAARAYDGLFRRVLEALPGMKVGRQLADLGRAELAPADEEPKPKPRGGKEKPSRGYLGAEADAYREAYAQDAYGRAVARLSTALISSTGVVEQRAALAAAVDDGAEQLLREIWAALSPQQARELFSTCVSGNWPRWVTVAVCGEPIPAHWDRARVDLLSGLDVVATVMREVSFRRRAERIGAELADESVTAEAVVSRPVAAPAGPKREEHFNYVDATGALLFEVVRRTVRRAQAQESLTVEPNSALIAPALMPRSI